MAKKAKRNPNDATMRNVRAATKRIVALEEQVSNLTEGVGNTAHGLNLLGERVTDVQAKVAGLLAKPSESKAPTS